MQSNNPADYQEELRSFYKQKQAISQQKIAKKSQEDPLFVQALQILREANLFEYWKILYKSKFWVSMVLLLEETDKLDELPALLSDKSFVNAYQPANELTEQQSVSLRTCQKLGMPCDYRQALEYPLLVKNLETLSTELPMQALLKSDLLKTYSIETVEKLNALTILKEQGLLLYEKELPVPTVNLLAVASMVDERIPLKEWLQKIHYNKDFKACIENFLQVDASGEIFSQFLQTDDGLGRVEASSVSKNEMFVFKLLIELKNDNLLSQEAFDKCLQSVKKGKRYLGHHEKENVFLNNLIMLQKQYTQAQLAEILNNDAELHLLSLRSMHSFNIYLAYQVLKNNGYSIERQAIPHKLVAFINALVALYPEANRDPKDFKCKLDQLMGPTPETTFRGEGMNVALSPLIYNMGCLVDPDSKLHEEDILRAMFENNGWFAFFESTWLYIHSNGHYEETHCYEKKGLMSIYSQLLLAGNKVSKLLNRDQIKVLLDDQVKDAGHEFHQKIIDDNNFSKKFLACQPWQQKAVLIAFAHEATEEEIELCFSTSEVLLPKMLQKIQNKEQLSYAINFCQTLGKLYQKTQQFTETKEALQAVMGLYIGLYEIIEKQCEAAEINWSELPQKISDEIAKYETVLQTHRDPIMRVAVSTLSFFGGGNDLAWETNTAGLLRRLRANPFVAAVNADVDTDGSEEGHAPDVSEYKPS